MFAYANLMINAKYSSSFFSFVFSAVSNKIDAVADALVISATSGDTVDENDQTTFFAVLAEVLHCTAFTGEEWSETDRG